MVLTHERWQRIQQLCEALETIPSRDHALRLEAIESDAVLRQEVLDLLQAVEDEASWSARNGDAAVAGKSEDLTHAASAESPGTETRPSAIGSYRIVAALGAGGSGEVFRAIRTVNGIDQLVALKRLYPQRSGREQLERFAREQRMLAALTHPDIVKLLDAGLTEDGRPFLVMDLAEGEPITKYCDRLRLPVVERLRLVRSVCDAVQAAHAHLIVHLDLKPSNILVADGRVKLLDFGTAKLVDPQSSGTRTEWLTPQYASPEQLRGEPVSVACDVYSLGLILYELVSAAWPFRRPDSMVSMAERAAGRDDPLPLDRTISASAAADRGTSPERLRHALRGDLDAICRKAIAHAPPQRYASVADLAEDLRRFEIGDPVRAQRMTLGYRARKLARRHAGKIAAAATLAIGLSSAAVYSLGQARVANLAASRAEAANDFLTELFTLTGRDAASRTNMTVRELLTLAEARIAPTFGSGESDQIVAADVETALAHGLVSQNAFPEGTALFVRARDRAHAVGDVPREAAARAGHGYVLYLQNKTDDAWIEAMAAVDLWSRYRSRFTPSQAVAVLSTGAATLSYVRTTDPVHRQYYEACVDLSRRAGRDVQHSARARCLLGLATSYTIIDSRYEEAEPLVQEAIRIQRADPTAAIGLGTTLQMHGMINRYLGRFAEDERAQRESYDIAARLVGADSLAAVAQRAVWTLSLLGVNRNAEAYREAELTLAAARRQLPVRGSYLLWAPLFTATASACVVGKYLECEAYAREAIESLGTAPPSDPRLASARGFLGVALVHSGRCAEGKPLVEEAIRANKGRRRTPPYARLLNDAASCAK
jgi:serine/threonine-protein kinase